MLGIGEKVSFTLHIYNYEKGLLGAVKIPSDICYDFILPKDTNMVEVKEFDGNFSLKNIFRIYLGQEISFMELLDFMNNEGKKVIHSDSVDMKKIDVDKSILCCTFIEDKIILRKIMDINEITLGSLEEIDKYIRKLSIEIGKLNRQSDNVRKLIRRNNG